MKRLKKHLRLALLFSLVSVAAAVRVAAADKDPHSVQVTIGTILVSNQSDEFDAKLKGMERQLRVLSTAPIACSKTKLRMCRGAATRVSKSRAGDR
jgi:hypothetical protein